MPLNYDENGQPIYGTAPQTLSTLAGTTAPAGAVDAGGVNGQTNAQWTDQNNGGIAGGVNLGTGAAAGGATGGAAPNWQGQNVTPDQIRGYFSSRNTSPYSTSADYWASKWPGLYQRGQELGNPNYAYQRLQYADEFLPGGPTTSPYYEAPSASAPSAQASTQIASPSMSTSYSGSVAPTWNAMLQNGSAYGGQSPISTGGARKQTGLFNNPQTLAQLAGYGG